MDTKLVAKDIVDYILVAVRLDEDTDPQLRAELVDEVVLMLETS